MKDAIAEVVGTTLGSARDLAPILLVVLFFQLVVLRQPLPNLVETGFGILLVEPLNSIPFFGFKLGFWWAQQGSIYVFLILIAVYATMMNKLDREHDVHED